MARPPSAAGFRARLEFYVALQIHPITDIPPSVFAHSRELTLNPVHEWRCGKQNMARAHGHTIYLQKNRPREASVKKKLKIDSEDLYDADVGVGEIDGIVGFHIRLAHGAVYRHFMETFSHLNLTQKQVSVLWLIDDHPGIAQTDLSKRLRMDRATVMAIINRLAARKFLVRGVSPTDKRKQTLKLLPGGQKALIEAKEAIRSHEQWLKERFTKKECDTLVELLRRIHG